MQPVSGCILLYVHSRLTPAHFNSRFLIKIQAPVLKKILTPACKLQ